MKTFFTVVHVVACAQEDNGKDILSGKAKEKKSWYRVHYLQQGEKEVAPGVIVNESKVESCKSDLELEPGLHIVQITQIAIADGRKVNIYYRINRKIEISEIQKDIAVVHGHTGKKAS